MAAIMLPFTFGFSAFSSVSRRFTFCAGGCLRAAEIARDDGELNFLRVRRDLLLRAVGERSNHGVAVVWLRTSRASPELPEYSRLSISVSMMSSR